MPDPTQKILYVDYYQDSREMMPRLLDTGGNHYDVTTRSSVEEALSAVSSQKFDLVILEYFMPEMRGEKFCRLVRGINPDVPIIVYGALPPRMAAGPTIKAGANIYLEKPTDLLAIPAIAEVLLQGN